MYNDAIRDQRIEEIRREGSRMGWSFEGFGGSSVEHETIVFETRGTEMRVPVFPEAWDNDADNVAREYGSLAAIIRFDEP